MGEMIVMKEISVDEFNKKADDLIRKWQTGRKQELEPRKLVETALVVSKYIPYILATTYYAWMNFKELSEYNEKKEQEKFNLLTNKSIERILSLAPSNKIDKEKCRDDMKELEIIMKEKVTLKDLNSASYILSDKIFTILQKYCPDAGSRERELVDYIVKAELANLK